MAAQQPVSALTASGEPCRRLLGRDGIPEFTSHCDGQWIILHPARTWEQWRELAQAILATEDPEGA
jgi:hypothetical protein